MAYQLTSAKIWDGAAWQNAVEPSATVSATTGSPTITTDGPSTIYKFTGDGSITFSSAGLIEVLVVGGGGGAAWVDGRGAGAGSGDVEFGLYRVTVGTEAVTVGSGGVGKTSFSNYREGATGGFSGIGSIVRAQGGRGGFADENGSGLSTTTGGGGGNAGRVNSNVTGGADKRGYGSGGELWAVNWYDGFDSSITGTAVTYGESISTGDGAANSGEGSGSNGSTIATGGSGVVIVRVN